MSRSCKGSRFRAPSPHGTIAHRTVRADAHARSRNRAGLRTGYRLRPRWRSAQRGASLPRLVVGTCAVHQGICQVGCFVFGARSDRRRRSWRRPRGRPLNDSPLLSPHLSVVQHLPHRPTMRRRNDEAQDWTNWRTYGLLIRRVSVNIIALAIVARSVAPQGRAIYPGIGDVNDLRRHEIDQCR